MLLSTANLQKTISCISEFYNDYKVGYEGSLGFRKSTDLKKFSACVQDLSARGILSPVDTIFLDLGCADGRVNVLTSYFVKHSLGIEIDSEILAEYSQRKPDLVSELKKRSLLQPPNNVSLFHGDSLQPSTYEKIFAATGFHFTDIDLFYTYITLHDLFGSIISQQANKGAHYLVYGFSRVLPSYPQLRLLDPDVAGQGIAALFVKE